MLRDIWLDCFCSACLSTGVKHQSMWVLTSLYCYYKLTEMWWGQQKAFLDQKRRYWIEIPRWYCLIVIKPEHQNLRVVDTRTEKQLGNPISSRTTSKILHKGSRKNSCSVFSTSTSGQIKKPKKKTVTHFPSVMYEGSPVIMIWFFIFYFFIFPRCRSSPWNRSESTTSDLPTCFSVPDQPTGHQLQSCFPAWNAVYSVWDPRPVTPLSLLDYSMGTVHFGM